jgi:hypothetical protein
MLKTIEEIAGKGTPLCESIIKLYTLCEGTITQPTQQSYDLLNQRYGDGTRPDPLKIAESVEILVDNDQNLYNVLYNTRHPARSVAWSAMMQELNEFLRFYEAKTLSSEQFKRWFFSSGMSLDEGMGPAIAVIERKRAERKEEQSAESVV